MSERVWQDRERAAEVADAFAYKHGLDLLETVVTEVADAKVAGAQAEWFRSCQAPAGEGQTS